VDLSSSNFLRARAFEIADELRGPPLGTGLPHSLYTLSTSNPRVEREAIGHKFIEDECFSVSEGRCAPGDERLHTSQTFSYTHGSTTAVYQLTQNNKRPY
jgi:hypothetical protein